jgi:hypothetical protein
VKLTLEEALRLLFLYAERDPVRYERAALHWLSRYFAEGKAVTLLKALVAASALAELRRWSVSTPRGCWSSWRLVPS